VVKGDRIAQLVLEKVCLADIIETDVCPFSLLPEFVKSGRDADE